MTKLEDKLLASANKTITQTATPKQAVAKKPAPKPKVKAKKKPAAKKPAAKKPVTKKPATKNSKYYQLCDSCASKMKRIIQADKKATNETDIITYCPNCNMKHYVSVNRIKNILKLLKEGN